MKRPELLCLALLAWLPGLLSGQNAAPGARVRIATLKMRANAGLLLAAGRDSLLIGFSNRDFSPMAVARKDLTSFKISQGGDGPRGAVVGGQIGMAAGAIAFGIEHLQSRLPPPRFSYDNGDLAFAALTGAAWGLVLGALTGAIVTQETWTDTVPPASSEALPPLDARSSLQTQVRLGLVPVGDPIRLLTREARQLEGAYNGHADGHVRVTGDSAWLIPITSVTDISERRPMTGPWLRNGALIGAALGVVTIAGISQAVDDECPPDSCIPAWAFTLHFGFGGALVGGALGAILGSYVKGWRTQKW